MSLLSVTFLLFVCASWGFHCEALGRQLFATSAAQDPNSIGFPDRPAWGWNKAPPKSSLSKLVPPKAWSANAATLNLVEFVHWAPIVPAVLASFAALKRSKTLLPKLLEGDISLLLLILTPIVQFFGGLPGIMMHTYEGWQVTPFVNPLVSSLTVSDNNNAWLREVAYKFIFVTQYLGLQCFSLAVLGLKGWHGSLGWLSLAGALLAYLGNQQWKATFYLFGQPAFPLAYATLVPFILAAVLNIYSSWVFGHGAVGALLAVAPSLLIALGGVIEGLLAETVFNQWLHILAVVFFNIGMWLQYLVYTKV
eukprot:gene41709-50904_t